MNVAAPIPAIGDLAPVSPPVGPRRGACDAVLHSIAHRIDALGLDLSGLTVVCEAATGAYRVTPVIAAMAGAQHVHAVGRDTARYGSFADAKADVMSLAGAAGVAERITVSRTLPDETLRQCDILTNSGHLRPIDGKMIARLPSRAVVALMFEAWEFRGGDLDLAACRAHGIPVAAVNERHADVGVFEFLGSLCVRLLGEAQIGCAGRRIALVCDNPFLPFLVRGLACAGASITTAACVAKLPAGHYDAVVLAINPAWTAPLGAQAMAHLAQIAPGAPLVQFWGDVERTAKPPELPRILPEIEPKRGHMAVLLSDLGHEPIVRLQAGGLRAAQAVRRAETIEPGGVAELL